MYTWWLIYGSVIAFSGVLSALMTLVWRNVGSATGFTDDPAAQDHKKHERSIPVLGGIAMLCAWVATLTFGFVGAAVLAPHLGDGVASQTGNMVKMLPRLGAIAGGGIALGIIGLFDDWRPMSAKVKFAAQIAVAASIAAYGIRVKLFIDHPTATWALTTMWILFIINAVNFFDNMDALAGGVAAIASFTFLLVAGLRGQYYVAALSASVCGVCLGFLIFNWPPASIFMGDCGSHFLGYILAILGAMTTFYVPGETPTYAPLLIPLLVLALPIFDTFAVVVIRLRLKHPIYIGDHRHISHRFQQLGLSRRCSVLLIHLLGLAIGAGALTLLWLPPLGASIVFLQTAVILLFISILHVKGKRQGDPK